MKDKAAFRYPGSKEKICKDIMRHFPNKVRFARLLGNLACYCEPYIGSGAMAMKVLSSLSPSTEVIFGDADPGVVALWRAVIFKPEELKKRLIDFTPSPETFYRFKEEDGKGDYADVVEAGFRKFVLHQMSFSGLGAKAGGPIGGKTQKGKKYAVDCRFRPERHARVINGQHKLLKRFRSVKVYHGDFTMTLGHIPPDGFAYLDPPYFEKGGELYAVNMNTDDHDRLAGVLRTAKYEWVLSYDDHPRIHELYGSWAAVNSFTMTAMIDTKRGEGARRKNNELVITKRGAEEEAA